LVLSFEFFISAQHWWVPIVGSILLVVGYNLNKVFVFLTKLCPFQGNGEGAKYKSVWVGI
jgi:hypothetical protein